MIALIVVVSVLMYATVGGVAFQVAVRRLRGYDPEFGATFAAIFWPIIIPVFLGISLGKKLDPGTRTSREERRRDREIKEALHEQELAKIRLREAQLTEEAIAIAQGRRPEKKTRGVELGAW